MISTIWLIMFRTRDVKVSSNNTSLEAMLENAEEAIAANATIEEVVEEVHDGKGQG